MNTNMNKIEVTDNSKNKAARLSGFFYLILAITGTFTFFVKEKLIVYGDPQVTAMNISSSELLFLISIVSELIMASSWILIAIALYKVFQKINNLMAVLMLTLVSVGGAIIYINVTCQIASLIILKNATGYLATFNTNQIQSLAMLFLDISKESVYANYLFMGLWMFPFAFFVYKSRYFPRIISQIWSVLLIIGGLGYITDFFTYFLLPDIFIAISRFAFGGDLFSIFWLLIMGVKASNKGQ